MLSLRKIKASPLYKTTWPAVKAAHGMNADWTARKLQQYVELEGILEMASVSSAFAWSNTEEGHNFWRHVHLLQVHSPRKLDPKAAKKQELTVLL